MRANRRRDTGPEIALRSALHRRGLRFRTDYRIDVPGVRVRADIVFRRERIAVLVDGCYWHSCPEHGRVPAANRAYWVQKFARNAQRDQAVNAGLLEAGWLPIRLWEHVPLTEAVAAVELALEQRREIARSGLVPQQSAVIYSASA